MDSKKLVGFGPMQPVLRQLLAIIADEFLCFPGQEFVCRGTSIHPPSEIITTAVKSLLDFHP